MVKWQDATNYNSCSSEKVKLTSMVSIGYLYAKDKKKITLATTVDLDDGTHNDWIIIPKDWVTRITTLRG